MPLVTRKTVATARPAASDSSALARDQHAFAALVAQIDGARSRFAQWEQAIALFRQKYLADLLPLQEKELALQVRFVRSLDRASARQLLARAEQRKLSALIVDLARALLARRDEAVSKDIKAIYNAHAEADFDAEAAARQAPPADEAVALPPPAGEWPAAASDAWSQHEAEAACAAELRAAAKRRAHAARHAAGEQRLSQSIRAVYRQMVSALHPDREPDDDERLRKTALMQRVNDAYARGDLLQLLELQLQLEHIDAQHLAKLDAERRRHYLRILKRQLSELEREIGRIAAEFADDFGLPPAATRHPDGLLPLLHADIAQCAGSIRYWQECIDIAARPEWLAAWLKSVRPGRRSSGDHDF